MRQPLFGLLNIRPFLKSTLRFAAISLALTVTAAAAQAQTLPALPTVSQPIAKVGSAKPIMGWVRFCEQNPAECAVDPSEPATINLTPNDWQTLIRVNRQVNAAIKAKTDQDHWGVEDRWDFAEDGYGDCEDYQLVKRKLLVGAGFSRRALRMAVVIDEEGAGHAVMMVRTDRGDFVLDNKRNAILPWHRTGYAYVKREGDEGSTWASLGGTFSSPTATAGR
ncbi:transglutaminase-like cysteine peptidase [Microvirga sp. Mcv34]|uniref:transglutaminase-like cysteine peptidase n=1 Tax=Microvirga sp. Mcv34 TaxID=2926016 RepID=UPI0021C5B621|nr:transglutaminase-like cysteine peptidase [Microvirga sp. Mcv34]